jgi:hypothetical protein
MVTRKYPRTSPTRRLTAGNKGEEIDGKKRIKLYTTTALR